MVTRSSDAAAAAARRAAEEAARRRAEEARRRAEEAARRAAEAAAKKTAETAAKPARKTPVAKAFAKDELSKGVGRALRERATAALGSQGLRTEATSLLNENAKDAKVNCLDLAADRLRTMSPSERAKTEVVFLKDTRPGAEGQSGHVLLKQGATLTDPVSGKSFASLKQFDPDGVYQPRGTVRGDDVHAILSTEPGSAARRAAITKADVSPELQKMMVADTAAPLATDVCVAPGYNNLDDATARVQQVARERGPEAAMQQLQVEAASFPDPKDVDALIQRCKPQIDEASQKLADRVKNNIDDSDSDHATRDLVESFSDLAEMAGPDGRAALGASTANALKNTLGGDTGELNQLDDRIEDLAGQGKGAAFSAALGEQLINTAGMGEAGNRILDMSTKALDKLNSNYDAAFQDYAQHNARLQADLAAFGPGMTDDQKAKYIEAFWKDPDHSGAKAKLEETERALRAGLEAAGPRLEQLAKQGDSDSAKVLFEGYRSLAKSPAHAQEAIDFFNRVGGDDALFARVNEAAGGELEKKLENEILPGALANAQGAAFAQAERGNPQALDDFRASMKTLSGLARNFKSLAGQVKNLSDTLEKLKEDPRGFRIESITNGFSEKSPLGKALAVAGVAMTVYAATKADPTTADGLKTQLRAVKGGLELTAGLLNTFGKGSQFAADGAKFLAGFAPYLGLAIDSINVAQDFQKVTNGGNVGDYISLLGSGVSWVGSLAGCIPIPVLAQIPDALLGTLGGIIRGIGGLVSGMINGNEEREKLAQERAELLDAAGLDARTRELLTSTPYLVEMGTLGLNREQFLGLCEKVQASGQDFEKLLDSMNAAAAFGVKGDEALRFIDDCYAAMKANPDGMYRVQNSVGWLDFHSYGVEDGGDVRMLEDDFRTVQIVFAQEFPELAAKYGTDQRTVDTVNVGYYAAA